MIFHTRREQFDEWRTGRWVVQFFEPRLWRWGWRYFPQVGYTHADPDDLNSPCIRPVPKGWALALPTLSIRKF
jgi:hypothetical protein